MQWLPADDINKYCDEQKCIFCICGTAWIKHGLVRWIHNKAVWYETENDGALMLAEFEPTHWSPIDGIPSGDRSRIKLKRQRDND
jgi:hypothetical protein